MLPRCFAGKTIVYHQAGGKKENAFVKEVAKALSAVALCYQMYFLRNDDSNLLENF